MQDSFLQNCIKKEASGPFSVLLLKGLCHEIVDPFFMILSHLGSFFIPLTFSHIVLLLIYIYIYIYIFVNAKKPYRVIDTTESSTVVSLTPLNQLSSAVSLTLRNRISDFL